MIYSRINFILLVIILYLAATFVPFIEYLCAAVLIGGLIFHGSMYYRAYVNMKHNEEISTTDTSSFAARQKRCQGENTNWYKRLNDSCY